MKKYIFLLASLVCFSSLVGCNSKGSDPEETFKISITGDGFFSCEKEVEFKKDDFSPIQIDYTITAEGRSLDSITLSSSDVATYTYDATSIIITPKVNTNFEVMANTKLAEYPVSISGDDSITFDLDTVWFSHNEFETIKVGFELNEEYSIQPLEINPADAGECTIGTENHKSYLFINPLKNVPFSISAKTYHGVREINFDPGSGKLPTSARTKIKCALGRKWYEYVPYDTQIAHYQNFDFAGWSFDTSKSGFTGEIIDPLYEFKEETPNTVYAVYKHRINLISESIKINRIDYSGMENNGSFKIYIELKNSDKFEMPKEKNAFTILNKEESEVNFDYINSDGETYLKINGVDSVSDGLINIEVTDYQPTYTITASGLSEHLQIWHAKPAKKGEDYTFSIIALNDSNDDYYYVPYELNIKREGDSKPLKSNAYKIDEDSKARQRADVTIFGQYVSGDITIGGECGTVNKYDWTFIGFGANCEQGSSGFVSFTGVPTELTLDFKAEDKVLTEDNIAIKFDKDLRMYEDWIEFAPKVVGVHVSYLSESQELSIKFDHAILLGRIEIYVMNDDYPAFEDCTWSQIAEIANDKILCDRLFRVGETKQQTIGDVNYRLRIVGMHHDTEAFGEETGLSIMFDNVITNSDGSAIKKRISDGCAGQYYDNELYNYITGTFYNSLPDEIISVIKPVHQRVLDVGQHHVIDITTRVFAPSLRELGGDNIYIENNVYPYFKQDGKNRRRLRTAATKDKPEGNYVRYFTRTKSEPSNTREMSVNTSGGFSEYEIAGKEAFTVVFCI